MGKIVLILEYDGTRYHGFQVQKGLPTIQGEMERALGRLTGERIRIASASRTDVGVHAWGQVVGFVTASALPPETFVRALNHYLPSDIAVRAAFTVSLDFDVRREAVSREYCYRLLNRPTPSPLLRRGACFVPRPLDVEAMNNACGIMVGTHDFAPFSGSLNGRRNTVRTVYRAEVVREAELVVFHIEANSFLPHQVRNTMGALVKVGVGKEDVESFRQIARSGRRGVAGPALPPYGLYLLRVNYPEGAW
jgi:tRNA pseudouridine38-40 synthase